MPTNFAAWQDELGIQAVVREAAYPETCKPNQIIIKAAAWGLNPADIYLQETANPAQIKYPLVLGLDVAGVVVFAGSEASSSFKPGDRVFAACQGAAGDSAMSAFQDLVIANAVTSCRIPEAMPFDEAVVLPSCCLTASVALFGEKWFGLPPPKLAPAETQRTIVVWGGSSCVGMNAIQLARAAGHAVIATSSPHNFALLQELGAYKVFDHASPTVVDDLVAEVDGTDCVGIYVAIGSVGTCAQISAKAKADLLVAPSGPVPPTMAIPTGVRVECVAGPVSLYADICPVVYADFLPQALARGTYVAAPKPLVMEKRGLHGIQDGIKRLKEGVSAGKVVVLAE